MASANEHEEQAASNEEFYRSILKSESPRLDWAVTVLFYTAVQEVQALFARKKWTITTQSGTVQRPETHEQRKKGIKQHCPQLLGDFSSLQNWSEAARYECESFNDAQVKLAEATLRKLQQAIRDMG